MGQLIDGQWQADPPPAAGAFERKPSRYRDWIGSADFPAAAGRYRLYVAMACPWAHRTLIARALKRLEAAIPVTVAEPLMLADGWTFAEPEPVIGARALHQLYRHADPGATTRATVPVLFDQETGRIVNNESAEIIRMLNRAFDALTDVRDDLYPDALAAEIDAVNARIYETVNNGVYRAGFARTQAAYDQAVATLFESLDWLEDRLSRQRYLVGNRPTEADWRLFPTLVRFDAVYHGHFKCNWRHVYEYPNLWGYVRDLYQVPGVAGTIDLAACRQHYYGSHRHLNPTGIVPAGPTLDFSAPHDRFHLT